MPFAGKSYQGHTEGRWASWRRLRQRARAQRRIAEVSARYALPPANGRDAPELVAEIDEGVWLVLVILLLCGALVLLGLTLALLLSVPRG